MFSLLELREKSHGNARRFPLAEFFFERWLAGWKSRRLENGRTLSMPNAARAYRLLRESLLVHSQHLGFTWISVACPPYRPSSTVQTNARGEKYSEKPNSTFTLTQYTVDERTFNPCVWKPIPFYDY